ncbi:MAG TPA: DUF2868 domain-containing protein [Burkholderiales bacterium]|nr:DUF2868 domain-containing protein [Burkholderiales bacterium]
MNEAAAREVVLVRAVESTEAGRTVWSNEDRAWASRAAAEVEGAGAPPERFIARRASLAIERLSEAHAAVGRALRAATWRPWVGTIVVLVAFAAGLAVDRIGAPQRINVLAFPLMAVLAWNLFVYAAIVALGVWGAVRRRGRTPGPIAGAVARLARGVPAIAHATRDARVGGALAGFAHDWARAASRLHAARVASVLHLAAFALAAGAIAGLYVRGLLLEYRAGWESTFLDATSVEAILDVVLGPAAALTGIGLPDAAELEAIRFGEAGTGENAASWIHLYAVTVALVVLVPRALLAAGTWWSARRLARNLPLPLDDAYFQRLARQVSGKAGRIRVVPYGYQLSPQATLGLEAALRRVFGARAEISIAQGVAWGGEDALPESLIPKDPLALAVALFNFAATPEPENHGTFLAALIVALGGGAPLVAVLDESAFRARFPHDSVRLAKRREGWCALAEAQSVMPVFVDLENPELPVVEGDLNAAIDRALRMARYR